MSGEPAWTDKVTAIAAGVALLVSFVSLYFSWCAQRLANEQERRRRPQLIPALLNGYFHVDPGSKARIYAFYLSVSNPTDSDNAVASTDLHLTYLTSKNLAMTIKLSQDDTESIRFVRGPAAHLTVPTHIAAHSTIAGWTYFRVDSAILAGARIEGHRVVLTDSHQSESSVEPINVQEYRHAP